MNIQIENIEIKNVDVTVKDSPHIITTISRAIVHYKINSSSGELYGKLQVSPENFVDALEGVSSEIKRVLCAEFQEQ